MNDTDSTSPLVLPSLDAFDALPVTERTTLFTRWVGEQPRNRAYRFNDIDNCPLAQFGQAISGDPSAWAGAAHFRSAPDTTVHHYVIDRTIALTPLIHSRTFGDLYAGLRRSLAISQYGWMGYHARRLLRLPILPGVL